MNVRCLSKVPNSLYLVIVLLYHRLLRAIFKQAAPCDGKLIITLLYIKLNEPNVDILTQKINKPQTTNIMITNVKNTREEETWDRCNGIERSILNVYFSISETMSNALLKLHVPSRDVRRSACSPKLCGCYLEQQLLL